MKTLRFAFALVSGAMLFLGRAAAQETLTQATITAVTGNAQVRLADGSSHAATVGLKLGAGAVLMTARDSQVSLQVHDGIVAVAGGGSHVTLEKLSVDPDGMRNATFSLLTGHLASSLDPARKSLNRFAVRTARGVARAQGTTLTVSVNNNVYTVTALAGTVTVDWNGAHAVSITGNTPGDVTSNSGGRIGVVSLNAALGSANGNGLGEALMAAAAAVASIATRPAEVTTILQTIATAAGNGPLAAKIVAGATAAATQVAVNNSALVASGGGATEVAATLGSAAVASATAAGNESAATLILASTVHAAAKGIPGTDVDALALALTNTANNRAGNLTVNAAEVLAGANSIPNLTPSPLPAGSDRPVVVTTPVSRIDPDISISPSGE